MAFMALETGKGGKGDGTASVNVKSLLARHLK
jgi:MinD superfamily P-loop ATPase